MKHTMRKPILVLLYSVVCVAITACSSGGKGETAKDTSSCESVAAENQLGNAADCDEEMRDAVEHDFVVLTDVVPDAIIEARYFGTYNFVGTRVDGYLESTVLMTREGADSLKAVSDEVIAMGYRLKVYDAYRPQRAVDHFMRWGADLSDTLMRPYFYPYVDKSRLFDLGYIAKKSGHSRGSTIDLTLFDMATGKELDMGGVHDWFGKESHPDFCGNIKSREWHKGSGHWQLTPQQFRNRMILRDAMMHHGFKPYECEWWHFSLVNEPYPDTYFDFPVKTIRPNSGQKPSNP